MDTNRFGGIDADADDLLKDCFRDHPAYIEAKEHRRFLIVGRKGSGKTAIFRRLITDEQHNQLAFGHSFDDYPWHHHDLQGQVGVPDERRFLHSWSYLINMSLTRLLLNRDQSQPWAESALPPLEDLERFVVDSYGTREPDVRQLFSPSRKLKLKGKLKLGLVELDSEGIPVPELPVHIAEVNQVVSEAVVESLNPDIHYYVCFDELDLGFEPDNPKYHRRLIGLILAARSMNMAAKDRGKSLTVAVFLRDDIYSLLKFEDKNKTTEGDLVSVFWTDSDTPGSLTLRNLMERRFAQVAGEGETTVAWADVFDESKQMPGRQEKYQHICDRTFLRPRDMIKFCNEIAVAQEGRNGKTGQLFENEDLSQARERYSTYLLKELEDEIHKHVPHYREYLNVLRRIGSLQFTRTRFLEECKGAPAFNELSVSPDEALQDLFDFSVIGVKQSGGASGGSRIIWRYRSFDERPVDDADTFRVHAGFKEALELIQGER